MILIGPQIANGQVVLVQIDDNGTTTVTTPNFNGGTPGGSPFQIQIAPTTTLAALQAILKSITG